MLRYVLVSFVSLTAAGCALGPRYTRPDVPLPAAHRGAPSAAPGDASLADLEWAAIFDDPALTALVTAALRENFDLRIAAERVQQARALYRIQPQRSVSDDRRVGRRGDQRRVARGRHAASRGRRSRRHLRPGRHSASAGSSTCGAGCGA